MMRCLFPFKDKSKKKGLLVRSAPTTRPVSPVSASKTGLGSSPTNQISKSIGSSSSHRSIPALYEERSHNLRVFELKELRQATDDFSRLLKIGEGGFGCVYKGLINPPDGRGEKIMVAIKKLNQNGRQSIILDVKQLSRCDFNSIGQFARRYVFMTSASYDTLTRLFGFHFNEPNPSGHKQWLSEVLLLGVVEHPNLVKLIGYCAVDGDKAIHRSLVYEFMPNKSLDDHLFNKAYPVLPWITRLHIALGSAEGVAYLHKGLEVPVIYRDFKASNILLDKNLKPKLSDFGLAREGPSDGHTHVTTGVVGTYGYAAPDYIETGKLTIKSDVWSFGVVLYEMITGRRCLERFRPRAEQKLLEWVKQFPTESRRFYMIIDPRLGNQYSLTAARMIATLANCCLLKNRNERPSMREVIHILKQVIETTESGSPKVSPDDQLSSTDSDNDKIMEEAGPVESSRRMEHLAKMTENMSIENRPRFMSPQATNLS